MVSNTQVLKNICYAKLVSYLWYNNHNKFSLTNKKNCSKAINVDILHILYSNTSVNWEISRTYLLGIRKLWVRFKKMETNLSVKTFLIKLLLNTSRPYATVTTNTNSIWIPPIDDPNFEKRENMPNCFLVLVVLSPSFRTVYI